MSFSYSTWPPVFAKKLAPSIVSRGGNALQDRVDGGDDDGGLRLLVAARERGQRREPAAFGIGLRRHPVIGQTIPRRERQHLHIRREEAHAIGGRHRLHLVGRDEQHEPAAALRRLRREIGVIAARRAGDGEAAFVPGDVV